MPQGEAIATPWTVLADVTGTAVVAIFALAVLAYVVKGWPIQRRRDDDER
jgi:hypothetical protein